MSTNTIKLRNPFSVLFAKGIDIEDNRDTNLSKEYVDVFKALSVKEKEVEQPINVTNNSSKRGGFGKKLNPIKDANTEKAMREMIQKDRKEKDGMEIGD